MRKGDRTRGRVCCRKHCPYSGICDAGAPPVQRTPYTESNGATAPSCFVSAVVSFGGAGGAGVRSGTGDSPAGRRFSESVAFAALWLPSGPVDAVSRPDLSLARYQSPAHAGALAGLPTDGLALSCCQSAAARGPTPGCCLESVWPGRVCGWQLFGPQPSSRYTKGTRKR